MAATAVNLLACLQVVYVLAAVEDGAKGYSRIFVASPGIRKYTYDIAHDPDGQDFNINFNPLDTEMDVENVLQSHQRPQQPRIKFTPQLTPAAYHQINPYPEYFKQIHLKIKKPTHQEKLKNSKDIQSIHAAYSKGLLQKPQSFSMEDFDLGLMGYGDFMDTQDYEVTDSPEPSPTNPSKPVFAKFPLLPSHVTKQIKLKPQNKPMKSYSLNKVPFIPTKTYNSPKLQAHKAYIQKVPKPNLQYGFKPMKQNVQLTKELFVPSNDHHLEGLGDRAFSKVFMSQAYAREGPALHQDFTRALFVPVMVFPGPTHPTNLVIKNTKLG